MFLEVLISIALISIVFVTLLGVGFTSLNISPSLVKQDKADFLAREEIEAIRAFRDSTASTWNTTGLGSYSAGTAYRMVLGGVPQSWSVASGSETTGGFTRQFTLARVSRDTSGYIVSSGGTDDPDTRKVTVQVTWSGKTRQITTYLTNWQK